MAHIHGGRYVLRVGGIVYPAGDLAELADRLAWAYAEGFEKVEAAAAARGAQYRDLTPAEHTEIIERAGRVLAESS